MIRLMREAQIGDLECGHFKEHGDIYLCVDKFLPGKLTITIGRKQFKGEFFENGEFSNSSIKIVPPHGPVTVDLAGEDTIYGAYCKQTNFHLHFTERIIRYEPIILTIKDVKCSGRFDHNGIFHVAVK